MKPCHLEASFRFSSLFLLPVAPKLTDIETWTGFFFIYIYLHYNLFAWLSNSGQPHFPCRTGQSEALPVDPRLLEHSLSFPVSEVQSVSLHLALPSQLLRWEAHRRWSVTASKISVTDLWQCPLGKAKPQLPEHSRAPCSCVRSAALWLWCSALGQSLCPR